MAEEAGNAAESLYNVLRQAVDALKQQDFAKVKEWLGEPYQDAIKQVKDHSLTEEAKALFSHLSNTVEDSRDFWLKGSHATPPLKGIHPLADNINTESLHDVTHSLHHATHDVHHAIEHAFEALKNKFVAYEESLPKNVFSYTGSLIQRRWDNSHAPDTTVEDALIGGKGLERFGGIEHLDNPFKKGGAIVVSSIGAGLIVHGGYNMYRAFVSEKDPKLELDELGHKPVQEGVNWLRLGVGITEATAGAATLYAALTGRGIHKIGDKVDAVALADLTGCGHDHGHHH